MKISTLARVMDHNASYLTYVRYCSAFTEAMRQANINTHLRAAMWCAQIGEESVGLKYMEELADGSEYEGRKDLGNIYQGDGVRFKGRGPIQITGRNNYTKLSQWAHAKGYVPTPTYFVDHPRRLGWTKYVMLGPVWYWTVARPQLNALADKGDIVGATEAINGGQNGLADRKYRYNHALAMTGLVPGK